VAHQSLIFHRGVALARGCTRLAWLIGLGCGAPAPVAPGATPLVSETLVLGADDWDGPTSVYHSKRFRLSLLLPNGKQWRVDDHSGPSLLAGRSAPRPASGNVATGERATLELQLFREDELMSRKKCSLAAQRRGLLASGDAEDSSRQDSLPVVATEIIAFPENYDTAVWVGVRTEPNGGDLTGHVYSTGSFLRQCFFFHLTTRVPRASEAKLGAQLAMIRARIFGSIRLDPARTADDYLVPAVIPRATTPESLRP
jgi:hypothetical protein